MAIQQIRAGTETSAAAARRVPLTVGFKATYGAGALADGIVAAGFGFFLLFYLTAVCGMSGTMAGMAKLIALLIDAVADPAIGLASDRLRSRFGRRLPFMVGGLLPFAGAFGLLFSMPASLTGLTQFVYVTACLVVLRVSLSFFVLPFTAAGAEVTDNYRERASIVAFRLSFQNAGILIGVVLGLGVFMAGENGLLNRENYTPFGWTCGAVMLVAGLIAIDAVRRAAPRLHGPEQGRGLFLAGFAREMVELSRNRSFLILFGTVLTYFLAYSAHVSLALHASRYFWKLDTGAIQLILLSTTLGPLLGAPISAFALRHIEKRTLSIMAFLAIAIFLIWPPLLQLYGPFSLTPVTATAVLFVNGLLVGTSIMIGGVGFQSMLADTADEHEWLFGVRREGLFFSGLTLAFKAASGLGGLIAGLALDAIQFPTDLASRAPGLPIPDEVLNRLALISGPLPALFAMVSPLFLIGYHLTRKRHAQIIADLQARNALKAGVES
ncbi:MFS transporter [Brevundimonas sp.]|uniref:MFS transporter n=1 Tax=Brevundimonas sp. TaxID=1871086 RepID=UPI002487D129|nr:MFS transporter [Brevundimonas sp.]MDI1282262.1 MFS transporter [Brevundimonas sp.]